ncbi:hypothetical protein KVT40_004691 [Elsinoe batatas]|uniref:F-box domain-containing protein n=1 Tax=Elsinoe batatas TaxID=2601811 RepID=A0A8K0PH90_9PEZI|nr:hypothetical protein KVT40_004691 [Elsinoe batatas]
MSSLRLPAPAHDDREQHQLTPSDEHVLERPSKRRQAGLASSRPSSAAVTAVMASPYLVEMILSGTRMEDLLRCMRVCKDWKHLIERTTRLQQKLFLAPIEKPFRFVVKASPDGSIYRCNRIVYPPEILEGKEVVEGYVRHPLLTTAGFGCAWAQFDCLEDMGFLERPAVPPNEPSWTKIVSVELLGASSSLLLKDEDIACGQEEVGLTWGYVMGELVKRSEKLFWEGVGAINSVPNGTRPGDDSVREQEDEQEWEMKWHAIFDIDEAGKTRAVVERREAAEEPFDFFNSPHDVHHSRIRAEI